MPEGVTVGPGDGVLVAPQRASRDDVRVGRCGFALLEVQSSWAAGRAGEAAGDRSGASSGAVGAGEGEDAGEDESGSEDDSREGDAGADFANEDEGREDR